MNPAIPPDEPPGFPETPYDIPALKQQVAEGVAECGAVVARYLDQLNGVVAECLVGCGGTWATCEACIVGRINEAVGPAAAVAGKCVGKLIDRAHVLFNQAQALAEPTLAKLPEAQAIATEILTGIPTSPPPQAQTQVVTLESPAIVPAPAPAPSPAPTFQPPVREPPQPLAPPQPGLLPCPPGTVAQFQQNADGTWNQVCTPTGVTPPAPPPQPGPGPITCPVVKPSCPSGFLLSLNTETNQYECKPILPNCPPPTEGCPTGFTWQWTGTAYACVAQPPPPPPPPQPGPGGEPGFLDIIGFVSWNNLQCLDTSLALSGSTLQTLVDSWDIWIQRAINRISLRTSVPGGSLPADIINLFARAAIEGFGGLVKGSGETVIKYLFSRHDCDYLQMAPPVALRAILSFIEHWIDVGFDDVLTNLSYTISRACPTLLPSQPATDAAFLRNKITFDTWQCWTRAVNDLDVPARAVMESQRTQPDAGQWISAALRELITPKQLDDKLRGIGIIDQSEADIFKKLAEQLPGPGDIVRFMMRDVADDVGPQSVVARFKLDDEFPDKFKGLLERYARSQGMSTDLMKYYWRAHWQWPSATQLFEMLHRLRADNNPKLEVTLPDVLQVLGVNDVIPIWRERLAAISYRLPRLRDTYGMYEAGLWKEPQLLDYYQSYGYPKDVAEKKVSLDQRKKGEAAYKLGALLTKSNVTNAFIAGVIGETEARLMLSKTLLGNDEIDRAIDHAKDLRMIAQRKRIMKSVKCQFVTCGITSVGAIDLLANAGWDRTDAAYEVSCWQQQCAAKPKEATAAMLCKWYGDNLLTRFEFDVRLKRMGWSEVDRIRIIGECETNLAAKRSKSKGGSNGQLSPA